MGLSAISTVAGLPDLAGFAVCHQLPERTLYLGGQLLPVCARDTGMYLGFVTLFLALALSRPRRAGFPPAPVLVLAVLFIGVAGLDWVTSELGLRTTTNAIRLATGLAGGSTLAILAFPILNRLVWRDVSEEPVFNVAGVVPWLAFLAGAYVLLGLDLRVWEVLPWVLLGSILFTYTVLNLAVLNLLTRLQQSARRVRDLPLPAAMALGMTVGELMIVGAMKSAFL